MNIKRIKKDCAIFNICRMLFLLIALVSLITVVFGLFKMTAYNSHYFIIYIGFGIIIELSMKWWLAILLMFFCVGYAVLAVISKEYRVAFYICSVLQLLDLLASAFLFFENGITFYARYGSFYSVYPFALLKLTISIVVVLGLFSQANLNKNSPYAQATTFNDIYNIQTKAVAEKNSCETIELINQGKWNQNGRIIDVKSYGADKPTVKIVRHLHRLQIIIDDVVYYNNKVDYNQEKNVENGTYHFEFEFADEKYSFIIFDDKEKITTKVVAGCLVAVAIGYVIASIVLIALRK